MQSIIVVNYEDYQCMVNEFKFESKFNYNTTVDNKRSGDYMVGVVCPTL